MLLKIIRLDRYFFAFNKKRIEKKAGIFNIVPEKAITGTQIENCGYKLVFLQT